MLQQASLWIEFRSDIYDQPRSIQVAVRGAELVSFSHAAKSRKLQPDNSGTASGHAWHVNLKTVFWIEIPQRFQIKVILVKVASLT